MGLAGMRERITALGGRIEFGRGRGAGAALEVLLPVRPGEPK
jgi:signal transduction histidine kinase